MTENQRTVALLIDYDNLQICYTRDAPGTQLDLGAVISLAQSYGRVVVARAYAEWNLLSERMAVYKAGIEPAFAPVLRPEGSNREGKSLADTVMVADGVDLLWKLEPDVMVLVTSDKDMVPLARLAKQRGTLVVVLGSDLTAVQLLEMANEFVTYRHLIKELGRPADKLALGRVREEPHLRRAREPAGAREVAAAREASLREPRLPQRRARPRVVAPVVPGVVGLEEAAPPVVASLSPGEALEAKPAPIDEAAQPAAPRRRRRRGGRGRRPGVAVEQEAPSPAGEGDGLASTPTPTGVQESRLDEKLAPGLEAAAGGPRSDRGGEVGPDQARVEAPPVRRPAGRRRPTRAVAEVLEPKGPEAAGVSAGEAPMAGTLKPWERWPTPRPERDVASPESRVPSPERTPGSPESRVPSPERAVATTESRVPSPERAAGSLEPRAPVESAETSTPAELRPDQAAEGAADSPIGETDSKPAPPRRPRARRPAAGRTAPKRASGAKDKITEVSAP